MNLPLNGRIAIIDDQINHAEPLMKVLSKRQLPFSYFSGEVKYLPNDGENLNDIRVLFLDINLIDNSEHENKTLKARLLPVLKRVISEDNYPYVIVYWSRHEHHKALIEEEIFNNELKNRKPIAYLSAVKSDFFNFDGTETFDFKKNIKTLFDKINALINGLPAYSYLLQWENKVHWSTDKTLQEIFSSYHTLNDWSNNSNYIIDKLGRAFLGKHYDDNTPEDRIRASFISFNSVFKDTLENHIYSSNITNPIELKYDSKEVESKVQEINEKLNLSRDIISLCESGNVVVFDESDDLFGKLLNRIVSFFRLKVLLKEENKEIEDVELKKLASKEHKKIKKEIKEEWIKIATIVTPICDYVQKENKIYDRIIKGVLIPSKYQIYIEDMSEAVYMLPITINHNDIEYIMILDFRYFVTSDLISENVKGIFRIRQELLAEIQSKLARHISRQGILFLDER
jgi:hypothetical protein